MAQTESPHPTAVLPALPVPAPPVLPTVHPSRGGKGRDEGGSEPPRLDKEHLEKSPVNKMM